MEQKESAFRKTCKGKNNNNCDGFSRVCRLGLPPQVPCSQEGLSLNLGDTSGKKTIDFGSELSSLEKKNSLHQLDHLVSLFCSLFVVTI